VFKAISTVYEVAYKTYRGTHNVSLLTALDTLLREDLDGEAVDTASSSMMRAALPGEDLDGDGGGELCRSNQLNKIRRPNKSITGKDNPDYRRRHLQKDPLGHRISERYYKKTENITNPSLMKSSS
jgi:hypothetical protein